MSEIDQRQEPDYERAARFTQGVPLRELRALSDSELIERHDLLMAPDRGGWWLGPDDYLRELTRRETERQSRRLEVLTWVIAVLTAALIALELVPRILGAAH